MRCSPCTLSLVAVLATASFGSAQPTYEPTWESLARHPMPSWFEEARFGIFIHWGVYSVPAWSPKGTYSEWYQRWLEQKPEVRAFHDRVYGKDFDYREFAPRFRAELFDPEQWARLFKRAGARYVVLTSKHHDGFALWPAPDSPGWNAAEVGPERDLCGDLAAAVRKAGLKMGFYYSFFEWYHPLYAKGELDRYVATHMVPQLEDLVERYHPDIVWPDGEWMQAASTWRAPELLAWLFDRDPDVVVNDRWGKGMRGRCGDFYTSEYGQHAGANVGQDAHPWEENRGIGASFGYNRNEDADDYRTATELIRLLVDTAARGGNLLLDVGPTADGRIPVIMQDRLLAIGRWLDAYGESIYGSARGPLQALGWGRSTVSRKSPERMYLHVFDWPEDGRLVVHGLLSPIVGAFVLAPGEQLAEHLETSGGGGEPLTIHVPRAAPDPHVSVVVLVTSEPAFRVAK